MFWKKKQDPIVVLAEVLAREANQKDLLGMSTPKNPTVDQVIIDAAKLMEYGFSSDYKVFAKEAWSRVLVELDKILDERTPADQVNNARGALRATLDLLRLSYQARITKESLEKEHKNVPSVR